MKAAVIIGIGIILIILSISYRNNKKITCFTYAFMWIIYTFCNGGNPDLEVYVWTYSSHIYVTSIGFDTAMWIFSLMGLPFVVFKGACGIFTLYFMFKAMKVFYKSENAVLALIIIFPFISSISQIRNGMMAALVLYAICQYIANNKIRPFVFKILLAALIHPVALTYLILILARDNFKQTKKIKLLYAFLAILAVELIITNNLLYNYASMFISNPKYLSWFDYKSAFAAVSEQTLNIKGKLLPVFEQLIGTGLVVYIVNCYQKKYLKCNHIKNNGYFVVLSERQLNMVKNVFYLLLFILPFYKLSPTYFRVYMNVTPLIYVVGIQLISQRRTKASIPTNVVFAFMIIYALFMAIMSELGFTASMLDSFSIM